MMPDTSQLTYQGRPSSTEHKYELAQFIRGLVPGDKIAAECSDRRVRKMTVEEELEEYDDTPDWTPDCLGKNQVGYLLTGHGTEYVLMADVESREPLLPRLNFPSADLGGQLVMRVEFEERGKQLSAEKTAGELLWRVDRHDGR